MFVLFVVLLIVLPILELAILIWVGGEIGVLPTIALLIVDSIVGATLMRSQGRAAWMRFNLAVAERRVPAKEVVDGGLVIFGGALLLTPGFITDIFGLLFLLPPTRAAIRKFALWRLGGRLLVTGTEAIGRSRSPGRGRNEGDPGARQPHDVDSTATEVDP